MVTVAATGAGLALPLLGAGAAHAGDAGPWDKVAMCETGGLWNANTHNGFFGGLAITEDTWRQYGGTVYAPLPDLASRAQQIAVAEKILADLGPDAWPGCEPGRGVAKDTGKPDADPGSTATATPAPTTPADTGAPAATPTPTPTDPTATPAPTDPTAPTTAPPASGTPTAPPTGTATPTPADPGTPTGSTAPAIPAAPTTPSTPAEGSGRHARPYSPTDEALAAADRATRTETTGLTAKALDAKDQGNTGNTDTSAVTDPGTYKVDSGDSLSGIAADLDVTGGWHRLYDANQQVIGDNPNLIKPGQILDLG
jgi:LysM repeat protein